MFYKNSYTIKGLEQITTYFTIDVNNRLLQHETTFQTMIWFIYIGIQLINWYIKTYTVFSSVPDRDVAGLS